MALVPISPPPQQGEIWIPQPPPTNHHLLHPMRAECDLYFLEESIPLTPEMPSTPQNVHDGGWEFDQYVLENGLDAYWQNWQRMSKSFEPGMALGDFYMQ